MTLAVSLHAPPTTSCATQLVPLNRRYPIAEVLDAAAEFAGRQGPAGHLRVRLHRGRQRLARRRPRRSAACSARFPGAGGAHVNLIPLNPTAGFGGDAPPTASAPGLRRPARGARGRPPRSGATAAPTSTPRAASSAPGTRCPAAPPAIGHNGAVNQWKWVNQFQPQTLVIATFLCYIDAVFGFLFGDRRPRCSPAADRSSRSAPAASASPTRSAGATRSRSPARCSRWSCSSSVFGSARAHARPPIINLLFDGALVALLLHPHEPRVPAHLVQVTAQQFQRSRKTPVNRGTQQFDPRMHLLEAILSRRSTRCRHARAPAARPKRAELPRLAGRATSRKLLVRTTQGPTPRGARVVASLSHRLRSIERPFWARASAE